MQLNSLAIENYRCIDSLNLDNLSPITVLVGRNNVGKSAVLEAVALASAANASWYDAFGDDLLSYIIDRRGGMQYADSIIKFGEDLATIRIANKSSTITVKVAKDMNVFPNELRKGISIGVNEYVERQLRKYKEVYKNEVYEELLNEIRRLANSYIVLQDSSGSLLEFAITLRHALLHRRLETWKWLFESPIEDKIIRSSRGGKSNVLFLSLNALYDLIKLYRKSVMSGKLLEIIGFLRQRVPYFIEIHEIEDELVAFIKDLERPVLLKALGDGFKITLAILFAVSATDKGLILMEEPECHLHPGYMDLVTDKLVEATDLDKVQLIISTHSSEFLELLLEKTQDLVKVVRLYRSEDTFGIDYETLDGRESLEELQKLKMDLRGP